MMATYARVSTEEQQKNETIQDQRQEFALYAERHPEEHFETFEDDGVSGEIPLEKRPGGKRLLAALRAGKFKRILVRAVDRLGRDVKVLVDALYDIREHQGQLESLRQGVQSLKDPSKIVMTTLRVGEAAAEKGNTRERTMRGSRRCAPTDALWLGGPCTLGYCTRPNDDGSRHRYLEVVKEEAAVVERIYRMAAAGESCVKIAAWLNRRAVPTGGGKSKRKKKLAQSWRAARVRCLLRNVIYKGEHTFHPRTFINDEDKLASPIQRRCPAIITTDLWERANAALRQRRVADMSHPKNDYLLRGLIRCGACGHTYCGLTQQLAEGPVQYYRCIGRYQAALLAKAPCRATGAVRGDRLEAAVWADVESFLKSPGRVIRELERQMMTGSERDLQIAEEIEALESRLAGQPVERERVIRAARRGIIRDEELDAQLAEINRETETLERQRVELRAAKADRESAAVALGRARSTLSELKRKTTGPLTFAQRRRIVATLVDRVTVTPDRAAAGGQRVTVRYAFDGDFTRHQLRDKTSGGLVAPNPVELDRNAYAMNQYLASQGFIVLSVNYRSGIGYGLEFREARNYGARGASEFNDVVGAGLYLRNRPDVNPARIGLWGGSYGGYLTALGLARASDLFAAGVDFHGMYDWNVVIRNLVPSYDTQKYQEAARVAFESSPMAAVKQWRSPVLLIHGDDDRNVPFSETVHASGSVAQTRRRIRATHLPRRGPRLSDAFPLARGLPRRGGFPAAPFDEELTPGPHG